MTPDPALGALVHAAMLAEDDRDGAEAVVLLRLAQVYEAVMELSTALSELGPSADSAWVQAIDMQDCILHLDLLVPKLIRARVVGGAP